MSIEYSYNVKSEGISSGIPHTTTSVPKISANVFVIHKRDPLVLPFLTLSSGPVEASPVVEKELVDEEEVEYPCCVEEDVEPDARVVGYPLDEVAVRKTVVEVAVGGMPVGKRRVRPMR